MLLRKRDLNRVFPVIAIAICITLLLSQCGGSTGPLPEGEKKFSINIPGQLTLVSEDGVVVSCLFDNKETLDQKCKVSGSPELTILYWPQSFDADGLQGFIVTLQEDANSNVMNPSQEVFRISRMERRGFANIETTWSQRE